MSREEELLKILERNESVQKILDRAGDLGLPNWYLGAGGITNTVWNAKHGFEAEYGIKDYDLVYCDNNDLSPESEDDFKRKGLDIFKDIPLPVEVTNEARVHIWYKKEFGYTNDQPKYDSVEEAIKGWSIIPTAMGIKKGSDGRLRIYAPYGLADLFNLTVRVSAEPLVTKEVYQKKTDRWSKIWPKLKVVPWVD